MTFLTSDHTTISVAHADAKQAKPSLIKRAIQQIGDSYSRAMQRRADREYLSANFKGLVKDTGIDPATLRSEIEKPFWRT